MTRFVYHSQVSAPVGPVPSARSTDIAVFSALHRPTPQSDSAERRGLWAKK
jgi:hypothetical protein